MDLANLIKTGALYAADSLFSKWPQPVPSLDNLRACKLVSHRGQHDHLSVKENTFAAFDAVKSAGVWGIECDIRWTRDLCPVIIHDTDCLRVFGKNIIINDITFNDLRKAIPEIPTLEELVKRYGTQLHLMLELKEECYPDPDQQANILKTTLSSLASAEDYHWISLNPALFKYVDYIGREAILTVAELNVRHISNVTIHNKFGGLAGHYFLINDNVIKKHTLSGQKIGTGFVNSKNCLFRELNRDVEWIFSDNAVALQQLLNHLLLANKK